MTPCVGLWKTSDVNRPQEDTWPALDGRFTKVLCLQAIACIIITTYLCYMYVRYMPFRTAWINGLQVSQDVLQEAVARSCFDCTSYSASDSCTHM